MYGDRRIDYYTYINSPEWRAKANAAKQRAGFHCQVCNRSASEVQLDAHHRTYERLGNENPDDITVLCRDCHELYSTSGAIRRGGFRLNSDQKVLLFWVIVIGAGYFLWQYFNREPAAITVPVVASAEPQATPAPYAEGSMTPSTSADGDPLRLYAAQVTQGANVRVGPGKVYARVASARKGTSILVAGYNNESGWPWYCIKVAREQIYGWISSELVSSVPDNLPVVGQCDASGATILTSGLAPASTSDNSIEDVLSDHADSGQYDDAYQQYLEDEAQYAAEDAQAAIADYEQDLRDSGQVDGCPGGCTTYPNWCPGAPIKGNVSFDSGERIYHVAGQEYYGDTKIDPAYGERWFCSETEAQAAGWRKAQK